MTRHQYVNCANFIRLKDGVDMVQIQQFKWCKQIITWCKDGVSTVVLVYTDRTNILQDGVDTVWLQCKQITRWYTHGVVCAYRLQHGVNATDIFKMVQTWCGWNEYTTRCCRSTWCRWCRDEATVSMQKWRLLMQ